MSRGTNKAKTGISRGADKAETGMSRGTNKARTGMGRCTARPRQAWAPAPFRTGLRDSGPRRIRKVHRR